MLARMSKMGKNPLSLRGAVVAEPEVDDLAEPDQVCLEFPFGKYATAS